MTPFQLVVVFFLVVVAAVRARVRGRPVSRKPGHSPSVGRSVVRNPSTPGPLSRPSPQSPPLPRRAVRCFDRHRRRARRRRRHGGECNNNLYFFYVGFSQAGRQAFLCLGLRGLLGCPQRAAVRHGPGRVAVSSTACPSLFVSYLPCCRAEKRSRKKGSRRSFCCYVRALRFPLRGSDV